MSRGLDSGKSREWADRLERHESSGLTVARWCESEHVSEASFYYWKKKLRNGQVLAADGFASSRDVKAESRESSCASPALGSFRPVRVDPLAGEVRDDAGMTSRETAIQATTIHLGNEFRIELGSDLNVAEIVVKQVLVACGALRGEVAYSRESE